MRVDLITYMGRKLSVHSSTKSFFDFNEIWYVGRGRWAMHDSMQYDPIQGQGHKPLKVGKSAIFKGYLLPQLWWGLANDHGFLN